MNPIELEIWRPKEDDPRYTERIGQRSAEEVFRELEQRLDGMGMLPDEYFLLDRDWQGGRLIPKDADVFVTTDYGESEGIYLDAYFNTIFTSNKNPALWREDFDEDATLLCALDRIFDDATVFKLRGESFRGKHLETVSLQTGMVKAIEPMDEPAE